MNDLRDAFGELTPAERLLAAICLVYPFRMVLWHVIGVDLHLGLVCFVAAAVAAVVFVRELPPGFPNLLDCAVLAFALLAVGEGMVLGGANSLFMKGLAIEARFAVFYLFARFFGVRRQFGIWLFEAILGLGIAAAVLGALEYHAAWGTLLKAGWIHPTPSFWKFGMPRLYSFPMTVVGTAYLLLLAVFAAAGLSAMGRRLGLVKCSLFCVWQALPLSLARVPMLFAVATTAAYAVWDRRRGWWFLKWSLAAVALAIFVYWTRGWQTSLLRYAFVGATLADGSANLHAASAEFGLQLVLDQPLGYGLGEAGQLAKDRGGLFPFYETHYVTIAVQLGLPGLAAFLWVVFQSGWLWVRSALSTDEIRRAIGFTGCAFWVAMSVGGLVAPTWSMIVPQLYFWLLTGLAANLDAVKQASIHSGASVDPSRGAPSLRTTA